jgi:hypothetical protein
MIFRTHAATISVHNNAPTGNSHIATSNIIPPQCNEVTAISAAQQTSTAAEIVLVSHETSL